jgi:hypothetical protein
MDYGAIAAALEPHGLIARGGFRPVPDDLVPGAPEAVVLVGNAGPALWRVFAAHRTPGSHPMNRWTRQVLDAVATDLGATALYPFDGPPWPPFQRWARKAEAVYPSPIGMLIHPDYGLWHAYRGALAFDCEVDGLPARDARPSPCETCADKPCLSTCPVGAFTGERYDVDACAGHLRRPQGADCLDLGCRARRACPVGRDATYDPAQARFHMDAFLAARD